MVSRSRSDIITIQRGVHTMKNNKKGVLRLAAAMILTTAVFLTACGPSGSGQLPGKGQVSGNSHMAGGEAVSSSDNSSPGLMNPAGEGKLAVHFIDVDQGDSILAESDGRYLLIDAGENDQGDKVVVYLQQLGIDTLDYVIGTHPHSDHIGGLDDVIHNFTIGEMILPPVTHTTKTYEEVLDAAKDQGLSVTTPEVGKVYQLGSASFEIIAPNRDYGDDLNNWSVGIKLTNGENSFVMCGDAEAEAESDICDNGIDISADVLKLGHHGSSTSSSDIFLDQVNPEYAVVSCGLGNSYGHPHKETMDKMAEREISVFRTDEQGTVVAVSDGESITWSASAPAETEKTGITYVLNTRNKKFHRLSCSSLPTNNREDTDMSREEIISQGYEPCKICNP